MNEQLKQELDTLVEQLKHFEEKHTNFPNGIESKGMAAAYGLSAQWLQEIVERFKN